MMNVLTELIWVELFCEEVDYLLFIAVVKKRVQKENGLHALSILFQSLANVLNKSVRKVDVFLQSKH